MGDFNSPSQSAPSSRSDRSDLAQLQWDVDRLYFITEALWRILKEKHGLDDQEIIRQIAIIDMEDGKIDGKKPVHLPKPCPKCARPLTKQRVQCMYCGEYIAANPFER